MSRVLLSNETLDNTELMTRLIDEGFVLSNRDNRGAASVFDISGPKVPDWNGFVTLIYAVEDGKLVDDFDGSLFLSIEPID